VDLVKYIQEVTGLEARATILGYIQRGGSPSAMDRLMASKMGYKAVDLLLKGKSSRLIGIKHNKIIDEDVQEAMSLVKRIDEKLYEIADVLSY